MWSIHIKKCNNVDSYLYIKYNPPVNIQTIIKLSVSVDCYAVCKSDRQHTSRGEMWLVSCEVWVGVLLCLAVYDMSYICTLPSACIYIHKCCYVCACLAHAFLLECESTNHFSPFSPHKQSNMKWLFNIKGYGCLRPKPHCAFSHASIGCFSWLSILMKIHPSFFHPAGGARGEQERESDRGGGEMSKSRITYYSRNDPNISPSPAPI